MEQSENILHSMDITNKNSMLDYVKNNINYLVVFPNRETKTYKTLKEIQKDICIDTSTISKKLRTQTSNIFTAKGNGYIFYIYKIIN